MAVAGPVSPDKTSAAFPESRRRATRQRPATSMSSRSQVSRTSCGISCRPWIRSASSSATAMSEPSPELHAARESRDAIGGDQDDRGEDEHGEPEDGDGGEIAALVEIEDEHREHLGLRGEEDPPRRQLPHARDEDEAPGGDEARAEERGGHT